MGGRPRWAVPAAAAASVLALGAGLGIAFAGSRSHGRVASTTTSSTIAPMATSPIDPTSVVPSTPEEPTSVVAAATTPASSNTVAARPVSKVVTTTEPPPTAASSTTTTTVDPCAPSDLGLIAVVESNDDVQLVTPEGGCGRLLASSVLGRPSWSPARDRLAVAQRANLALLDVASGNVDVIVTGIVGVAWSPRGDRIAFSRFGDSSGDHNQLLTVAVDGTDEKLVADTGQVLAYDITWSPDASKIAFTGYGVGGLTIVPAGGGTPREVVADAKSPTWGRDGRIIFVDFRSGVGHVHVINGDGSGDAPVGPDGGVGANAVTWSSDQTRMLALQYQSGTWALVNMASDGTDPVTIDGSAAAAFAW